MYYDPSKKKTVIPTAGVNPAKNAYGSGGGGYVVGPAPQSTTNRYGPAPGKSGGSSFFSTGQAPAAPAGPQGLLRTPGEGEQWWNTNKERLSQPSILSGKGYTEELFESGNQGLNKFYDRERDKRQTRLEDQMSAMGVFGSSDTMKGMWELEAELGAQQARDMQGLATEADSAKAGRDRQLLDRDRTTFGMASDTQDMFQDRVRMPLQDKERLAGKYSDIFRSMEGASDEEQVRLRESIIQSIITEGGMDYAAASQQVDELMQSAGIVIKAIGNK